jgi:multiple sugar transport system permease protein
MIQAWKPIGRYGTKIFLYASLLLASAVVLIPLYIVFVNSFKGTEEFATSGVFTLPRSFLYLENLRIVLERGQFGRAFANTGIILVVSVTGNVLIGTMAAYAIGRFDFKLKSIVLLLFSGAVLFPAVTTQVARFGLIKRMGIMNTHFAPVVLYLGTDILQLYMYLQFLRQIPRDLDESAMLEGASLFRIFRTIHIPLMIPAIATVVIMKVIGIYNDMYTAYLYMPSRDLNVVSTVLMRFSSVQTTQWNVMSMAILLIVIPTVVMYLFMQRYIFAGIISGAIK